MYLTEEILDKLNSSTTPPVTLADIMVRSFAEVKTLAGDSLSWGEKNHLWQQAQTALKENRMAESRILSRANPQLANAVRLSIRQSAMLGDYNDLFPARAGSFVKPGSVASMFSPAGYLTELYREARKLHDAGSQYNLDKRRPDLASLSLSQGNMDDELSTLSLSNELLLNNIETAESLDYDGVMKMLSTHRQTGMTPFHLHYESARQAIMLQDEGFTAFRRNPDVAKQMHTASLLGIEADISPELYELLTEDITEENTDALIKKNFGEDVDINIFQDTAYMAHWYGLTNDELASMRGIVFHLIDDVKDSNISHYANNSLVMLVEDDGVLSVKKITVEKYNTAKEDEIEYFELIPDGEGDFFLNYKLKKEKAQKNLIEKITVGSGQDAWRNSNMYKTTDKEVISGLLQSGVGHRIPSTFSMTYLNNPLPIAINFIGKSREYIYGFYFTLKEYSYNVYLLTLNKLIRLYKATGMAPSDIRTVIESDSSDLNITSDVLSKLFWARYYMQLYGADVSAALVLCGSDISQINHSGEDSAFNRLFNTPLLNNAEFAADGTEFDLTPGGTADSFRSGVLKRAFQVNDTELFTLWSLAQGRASPGPFTATVGNLSVLFRVKLLADVHGLSVTELAALLSVSPYADAEGGIAGISRKEPDLAGLVSFLDKYTRWLKDEGWTVSDLYLMTTGRYSTALSPDIENLVTTLKDGLPSQADDAGLIRAAAPFIAAAMQLDSADTATALLQWLDQLKPQGLTVKNFLVLVAQFTSDGDNTKLVAFCQVLGQLALIVRSPGLTAGEIALAVAQSDKIRPDSQTLPQDIATVRALTRFHHWLQQCGPSATEILSALGSGTLTPGQLAQVMMLDEQMVVQGLDEADKRDEKTGLFDRWTEIDITLQWVDMAATLGITPAEVRTLINVKFADDKNTTTWSDWVAFSNMLQGGLSSRQTAQLQAVRDEALSTALSAYAIKNIAPSQVTSRDELYSWLLMDNQVSAQIKTTRIAEAIAGVQLYVNRALSGQEEGVDNAVKSKPFFTRDWDTYNKRYSTWAGVSALVYYPENYIDPTLRIGQTGMMDEMLQTLSQSQLTSDTVEEAFKTYMTRFEEIANLDIISGYHDSVSDQNGMTYLIGRSAIGDHYWRSADTSKMSDGKLPANAWTEWKKISAAITPVSNLVRPVIFLSRLYLVWVESKERSPADGSDSKKITEYSLKYAHILHDGTWSAPVTVKPGTGILPPAGVDIADTGMYCAKDAGQEKVYIFFYKKESNYSSLPSGIAGLSLSSDGLAEDISASAAVEMTGYIYLQLDTTSAVRLNTPYTPGDISISISGTSTVGGGWGDLNYTYVTGTLTNVTTELSADKENIVINFNAAIRLTYNGYAGESSRITVDLMKAVGRMGHIYYVPGSARTGSYAATLGFTCNCVIDSFLSSVSFAPSKDYVPYNAKGFPTKSIYYAIASSDPTSSINASLDLNGLWVSTNNQFKEKLSNSIYVCRSNPFPAAGYDFEFFSFQTINTFASSENAKISVGGQSVRADTLSKLTFDESLFDFSNKSVTVPLSTFSGNTALIAFTMSVDAISDDDRSSLGSDICTLALNRVTKSSMPVITLNRTDTYAQYLQYGVHRIRVNTLFAKQLVARANAGLDTVLSWDTQQLQEPKLGEGNYVEVTFSKYDKSLHGEGWFELYFLGTQATSDDSRSKYLYASGNVSAESETTLSLFLPWDPAKGGNEKYSVYIGVKYSDADFTTTYTTMQGYTYDPATGTYKNNGHTTRGLTSSAVNSQTEPMDFSGANALYFWEMFYYVPMMVFKRLLSENRFTEATQWIKYIWNPDGYLINDQHAPYTWNVRPLEEEVSWHANPLDSVDPDAVSQADPLHYKVATFMAYLDLLIARGDAAYRMLERDTLSEAKMWYVQALGILGDEPYLPQNTAWTSPRLTDAADETTQKSVQQALLAVRQQAEPGELRTANSLTGPFLPQQNEKLAGYWQTLNQRLYNLRHNLSIDGNPLSLAIFAAPADPATLLSAAVSAASGGVSLPTVDNIPLYRFPVILESARGLVSQLTQFGNTLLSITERQDAEALSELLQTQGSELVLQSIAQQMKTLEELNADKAALEESRSGAQSRLESYTRLYEENVNTGERQAMDLFLSSSIIADGGQVFHTAAGAADLVPNIFGLADGGSRWGAAFAALGCIADLSASATRTTADRLSQSEMYRRRREEWGIQRNNAQSDVKQIDAQLASLAVRREAAVLQKTWLETQQSQTQAQMTFLQNKFSNRALYNWLRGRLSAIYYQFYDLTVSRCLMAQQAYNWALSSATVFIRPGAWQGTYAGLMAGETLMLNLAQMEQDYLKKDQREKEVTRTVCLSEFYAGLSSDAFTLADQVVTLVTAGKGSAGTDVNGLKVESGLLQATLKLADLNIGADYPDSLGNTRRIKQISVTLPALVGPYQDVRAVLSYKGVTLPQGCDALAVSHGMNDSGQFQLDFDDSRWLPFEGIPVDDGGTLTLSFPDAAGRQKDLLLSLTDIILHIRYTIITTG